MSILFTGSYANKNQQLWASYASNAGSAGTLNYCNSSAFPGDIATTISVKLPTVGPYPNYNYYDSPLVTLLNAQRNVAEDSNYPIDTTITNANISFGVDSNIAYNLDAFNIYSQDQYGVDRPLHLQGVPMYITTTSQNDDRPYNGSPSFFLSAYGPTFSMGGSPGTGLIMNNSCNMFDSTSGTGEGTLYVGDDGNLHWYNVNLSTDNQITPVGSASSIYNFTTNSSEPIIISATTNTDGSFVPLINVIEAVLENTTNGNASIFSIQYSATTPYGGPCEVVIMNQDLVSGAYYPIQIQTSGDTNGCLLLTSPPYGSSCSIYPDQYGNLHGVTSGGGGSDSLMTGMNPVSYNNSFTTTANQSTTPTLLANSYTTTPNNLFLQNNAIVSVTINGTVNSPTLAQDMIALGFQLNIYYNNYTYTTTLETIVNAYVSGILGEPYPISCSFTELVGIGYDPGYGYPESYGVDITWNNGFVVGGIYGFNFQTNITITPQL